MGLLWLDLLLLVLLRVRCSPRHSVFSPFEILFGRPPPVIAKLEGDPCQRGELELFHQLQALGHIFQQVARKTPERASFPLGNWVYLYKPGDVVWVKNWRKEPLQPLWVGPRNVILATPRAVKVAGIMRGIHHTRDKRVASPERTEAWTTVIDLERPLQK